MPGPSPTPRPQEHRRPAPPPGPQPAPALSGRLSPGFNQASPPTATPLSSASATTLPASPA